MDEDESKTQTQQTRVDLFRDTWVRYLGYANEVGESFRALVHVNVVRFSYLVSCTYVAADAAHKGSEAKQRTPVSDSRQQQQVVRAVCDTLLWQGLASVAIPGFTINRLCATCRFVLRHAAPRTPVTTRKCMSTAAGLAAIPVIVTPIDRCVDWGMNRTVRAWYRIDETMRVVVHHQRDCDTPDVDVEGE